MAFLYDIGINSYWLLLRLAKPFHGKAAKMLEGRKGIFQTISEKMAGNQSPVAWFHCASLGEFEQGRPLMEAFAQQHPEYKIVLTFFSPSGYEIRKNYAGAHYIFYLPADSAANARKFLDLVKPQLAVFVKYEFWHYYLHELHRRHIPTISVSAIFRENQLFFKRFGGFYLNLLKLFTHIFTQNQHSADLLKAAGITNVTVAGDTRFDRVLQTAQSVKSIPLVELFVQEKQPVFIIGSSWPQDMQVLLPFIKNHLFELKFIIAPHEIHEYEIQEIVKEFPEQAVRFSEQNPQKTAAAQILIIDNIGMLSSLYQYGTYAFIGGAFGKGLHNTLEAAVFGLPLFFGPNYQKFEEARELIELGCAFSINNTTELEAKFQEVHKPELLRKQLSEREISYIHRKAGATTKIIQALPQWLQKPKQA